MSAIKTKSPASKTSAPKTTVPTASQLKALSAIPKGGAVETYLTPSKQSRARVLDAKGVPLKTVVRRCDIDVAVMHGWLESTSGAMAPDARFKISPKGRRIMTAATKSAAQA